MSLKHNKSKFSIAPIIWKSGLFSYDQLCPGAAEHNHDSQRIIILKLYFCGDQFLYTKERKKILKDNKSILIYLYILTFIFNISPLRIQYCI